MPIAELDPLRAELDAWAAAGRRAAFFWRDDDAIAVTPPLERLLALTAGHGAPLALAVIPQRADRALADRLAGATGVAVLQHGYSHVNYAAADEKKCEFPAARPADDVAAELTAGRDRLRALFGPQFLSVLAPPWNRIAPAAAAALPGLGFCGLSTHAGQHFNIPGLMEANTWFDPVDWRGAGGFIVTRQAVDRLTARLTGQRRTGEHDRPVGVLSHHLAMDDRAWVLFDELAALVGAHPGAAWRAPAAVFAPPDVDAAGNAPA